MKMKRTLSLVLALVMVLGTFTTVLAEDVSAETEAGLLLEELGVLEGSEAEGLMLEKALKREQAVVMLSRLMGEEDVAKDFPGVEEILTYEDLEKADPFYLPYLAWAYANEYFVGHSPVRFGYGEDMTGKQYLNVLIKVLGYEEPEWEDVMDRAVELGLVEEAEEFAFTRGTMAALTVVALNTKMKDSESTLAEKLEIKMPVVEPEVPATLEVVSVSANNLKEVEVVFNQEVDEDSATKLDNYTFAEDFDGAKLLEDGATVVLTLKEGTTLKNQKEYKLTVNNVLAVDSEVKLAKIEKKFVAVDNTLPTVKDVVGLGTKAIEVVFSEPVKKDTASRITAYKIDGKVFSGSIKYVYPNSVIISTNLTVGEHELSVKDVEDYAGFKVQEPGFKFEIAEDTTAPEIVSAKSIDLYEVELIFNEPVKSMTNGYHTSKSNAATRPYELAGKKVVLNFKNAMTLGNTTIYVDGVEDYSGNKADRTIVITPELDTTRPEVVAVDVEDGKEFTVALSKKVFKDDAEKGSNYIIKDSDGKVPAGYGLNAKGNPIVAPKYDDTKREVTFDLVKSLPKGNYTLEISGIRDNSYIKNTMLPYTEVFEVGDTGKPSVVKSWIDKSGDEGYIYIQFSEPVATEGNGNALELVKYNYTSDLAYSDTTTDVYAAKFTWKPIPTKSTIDLVGEDTVRINLPEKDEDNVYGNISGVRVTLVADLEDNFLAGLVAYQRVITVANELNIAIEEVKAIETDTIEVTFGGKLITISASDFELVGPSSEKRSLIYDDFKYDGSKTIATFKLPDSKELTEDVYDNIWTFSTTRINLADVYSQDAFGSKVNKGQSKVVVDKINPTIDADVAAAVAGDKQSVNVTFNEAIVADSVSGVVSVKVNGKSRTVKEFTAAGKVLTIEVDLSDINTTTDIVEVSILDANKTVKAITDKAGNYAVPDTVFNK